MMFNENILILTKNLVASGSNSDIFEIDVIDSVVETKRNFIFNVAVSNKSRDFIKNLVAKVSPNLSLIEIEILSYARINKISFIAGMEGHSVSMLNNSCVLLNRAQRDLDSIHTPITPETQVHLTKFFSNVLDYFKSINTVYCDWKPANILEYSTNEFKLTDFGSCLENNRTVAHPCNINAIYCSPYLMNIVKEICPKFRDDLIGVAYVFMKLKGIQLPWATLRPNILDYKTDFCRVERVIYAIKIDEKINRFNLEKTTLPNEYKNCIANIYQDFQFSNNQNISFI